ncbi:hypothetical protein [Fredinandcohnia sp. 179-A 10B2 NHS]|uniref:hypothetical protein n=1 Tax=Fredinandcohnia sp. 179-A 10B2 NHS TaxID=3235176 RepID=UPI0039A324EC
MKKLKYTLIGVVVAVVVVIIYLENYKMENSYSTVEEALQNSEFTSLEVQEVIKIIEEQEYSYVVYYTQLENPKDYIAMARFQKNRHGWLSLDQVGVAPIEGSETGDFTGNDNEYFIGIAKGDIAGVKLGSKDAILIPLNEKGIKIWFFHQPSVEVFDEKGIQFLDKEGNIVDSRN